MLEGSVGAALESGDREALVENVALKSTYRSDGKDHAAIWRKNSQVK